MNRQDEADYTALKEYLCDMILEEQLKLGYERETIRFYSPSSSIGHVLKLSDRSKPAVLAALEGFGAYAADTLSKVAVSGASGGRICFLIPAAGAEYVHAHGVAHPFLKDLIDCFGRHDVTREQVWELLGTILRVRVSLRSKAMNLMTCATLRTAIRILICTASSSTRDMRFITAS